MRLSIKRNRISQKLDGFVNNQIGGFMLNRVDSIKNRIVDFVTAKERLLNAPKNIKERQHKMLVAYANRRKRPFIGAPL